MKTVVLIISIFILCASCGVKEKPEYKSQSKYNKTIQLI